MPNKISGPLEIINTGDDNLKVTFVNISATGNAFNPSEDPYIEVIDEGDASNDLNKLKISASKGLYLNTDDVSSSKIVSFQSGDIEKAYISNTGNISFSGELAQTSSILFKDNIANIEDGILEDFIENIDVKKFNYLESENNTISIIIEDEEYKNNLYNQYIINDESSLKKFDEIPPHLFKYLSGQEIDQMFLEIDGKYYAKEKRVNLTSLLGLTIGALKLENKKRYKLSDDVRDLKIDTFIRLNDQRNALIDLMREQYDYIEELEKQNIQLKESIQDTKDDISKLFVEMKGLKKSVGRKGDTKCKLRDLFRIPKKVIQKIKNFVHLKRK